ncbi:MAG: ankyrin repeat domain-containing protein, partial [Gammaproteobacteria bacterium]
MTRRAIDRSTGRRLRIALACMLLACMAGMSRAGDLQDMIRSADTAALREALASGIDTDALGQALHVAVLMEDLEAIRLLYEHGADLEAPNRIGGAHPLHVAADIGLPPVINLLIDLGAELDARDDLGRTPLIQAAIAGNSGAVEVLLAAGADADAAETRRGTTALHLAAFRGHREVIDVLLTYGA